MNCPITKLLVTDDVTLVSIKNANNSIEFLDEIFLAITKEDINLDMITQNFATGEVLDISFTVSDKDLAKIVSLLGSFKKIYSRLVTEINSGNTKLAIFGEDMPKYSGVASSLFTELAKEKIAVKMITTSDTDISVLINHFDADNACKLIKNRYSL